MVFKLSCKPMYNSIKSRFDNLWTGPKFRRRFGLRVPISQAPVDQRLSRPGSAAILTLAPETADIRPMAFPPEIVNAPLRWPKTPGGASTGHVRDQAIGRDGRNFEPARRRRQ